MKIRKVTIKNLNSLRLTSSIDFVDGPLRDTGLFAITGDTGAGKTTILDAITLALYGRIHRNKDVQEVMSYGAAESLAEVEFDNGEDRYLARWMLWRAHNKPDGNLQPARRELARWNPDTGSFDLIAERVREAEELIEAVTGLDYDRFTRSVLLAQGDFAAFLQASERERSDLLERITGTGVYTRLSQAAYERNKLELQRLEDLQRRRDALEVLDEDAVKNLEKELREHQTNIGEKRKTVAARRADLQRLQRLKDLENRIAALQTGLKAIEADKAAAGPELGRLEQYERLRRFEPRLQRLDDLRKSAVELREEAAGLQSSLQTSGDDIQKVRTQTRERQATLDEKRRELAGQQAVFEQVIRLDAAIQEKEKPLEKQRRETKLLQEELEQTRLSKKRNEQRRKKLEQEQKQIRAWLKERAYLRPLQNDLSGMEQLAGRWREKHTESNRLTAEMKGLESALQKKKKKLAQLERREREEQTALDRLQTAFKEQAPENYAPGRSELLELLAGEIERLNRRREGLQQVRTLHGEYQELLRRQDQYEAELEDLTGQDLTLNKELMTALEVLEDLDKRLTYQQEIYQQQQMIANYEKDRRQLKEGEPCPLCFSREHPFREKEVQPFVDQARRDLERVTGQKEKAYLRYQQLLRDHDEISVKIKQLMGDEKERKGRRQEVQEQIEIYEARIVEATPGLGSDVLAIGHPGLLDQKLLETENQIESKRRGRESLQKLNKELEKQERACRELRETLAEQRLALQLEEKELKTKQTLAGGSRAEAQKAREGLEKALKGYPYTLNEVDDPQALLTELRREKNAFSDREEQLRRTGEFLKLNEQEIARDRKELERLEKQWRTAEAELSDATAELEEECRKRRELFGERDPRHERKALNQDIEALEQALAESEKSLKTVEQEQQRLQTLLKQKRQDQAKIEQRAEKLEQELLAALQKAEVDNLAELRNALLPEEERKILERRRKNLEERELETRNALEERQKEFAQYNVETQTGLPESELHTLIEALELELEQLQQASGALRERLTANETRRKQAAALLKDIDAQRQEHHRWAKLNDIIGAADGKKFRVFAQGLTLSRLVRLANDHLQHLNGRYFIRKRSDEDLGIEIVDTFQADNCRSMNTLSGGESFLVSLALALGLSDLAGQQTNIRSLFIDEGFGSLDENSLDLAISTLENLQAGGKTIGIISHVKELKERIAVQIQVRKKGSGFSEIEIVG